jgi:ATP/maltotriose-dependent transcriptional regulator MalT
VRDAQTMMRELGDMQGVAETLYAMGVVAEDRGDYDTAISSLSEALALLRSSGNTLFLAFTLNALGLTAYGQGDLDRAEASFTEALTHFRAIGEMYGTGFTLTNLGKVALAQGHLQRAALSYGESLALWRDEAERLKHSLDQSFPLRRVAGCLRGLGSIAATRGDTDTAATLFGVAEAMREGAGLLPGQHRADHHRTIAALRQRLGAHGFDVAWQAGKALPLDAAVSLGLAVASSAESDGASGEQLPAVPAFGLTSREAEVLRLLAEGYSNPGIADALFISPRTAQTHVQHIFAKLGVNTRAEAVRRAVEHQLL